MSMLWKKLYNFVLRGTTLVPKNATLEAESGSTVNLAGTVQLAGTAITATAAEINILDGVTATAAEINQAADVSEAFEVVAAANVIAATENGKTFFLNSATEFASTLPAPAAGLHFTFIVTGAPSGADYTITTTSSSNIIKGQVYTVDVNSATDPDFEVTGADTISFVSAKAVAGDRVDVVCDGTNWFAYAFCSVFDAITITTAS